MHVQRIRGSRSKDKSRHGHSEDDKRFPTRVCADHASYNLTNDEAHRRQFGQCIFVRLILDIRVDKGDALRPDKTEPVVDASTDGREQGS